MKTRWLENTLLVVGLIGLDVWIWSHASLAIYGSWGNWVFDHEAHQQPATIGQFLAEKKDELAAEVSPWLGFKRYAAAPPTVPRAISPPLPHNGLLGRLTIPRLHISAMVREGTGEDTLSLALGHIPHTALPGQPGNVGVAGHRDELFRGLRNIRRDDLITFETRRGKFAYQVQSTSIVTPQDVDVLHAGPHPELTLVTCYPFYYVGSAPQRFIVKAREVSAGPQSAANVRFAVRAAVPVPSQQNP